MKGRCNRDDPPDAKLLLAQLHTDEVGRPRRNPRGAAAVSQIHELAAPYLLGKDLAIQLHNCHFNSYLGFSSGAGSRRIGN